MGTLDFDSTGIQSLGAQAGSLAEELLKIHGTWKKATASPGDAFGLAELKTAYQNMQGSWDQELDVYTTVLDQARTNLQSTGATYGAAESAVLRSAQHTKPRP